MRFESQGAMDGYQKVEKPKFIFFPLNLLTLCSRMSYPHLISPTPHHCRYAKMMGKQSLNFSISKSKGLSCGKRKVKKMRKEYHQLNRGEISIWECYKLLNDMVDESNPGLDEPQIKHLLQSTEAITKDYPNEDCLHFTALIHVGRQASELLLLINVSKLYRTCCWKLWIFRMSTDIGDGERNQFG